MISITVNNVNPKKLAVELQPFLVRNTWSVLDEKTQIVESMELFFTDDVDMDKVQQIIEEHDTTPLPEEPSLELKNRADIDYLAIMTGVDL